MKLKNYYITCYFLFLACQLVAQDGTLKKADSQFSKYAFVDAAKTYKKLVEKGLHVDYATRQLADCYSYLRDPEKATVYYEKAVQQDSVPIAYYYKYAQALRGIKDYKTSRVWLEKFYQAGGNINETKFSKDIDFLSSIFNAEHQYFLEDVKFNSKFSDFGAYENNGNLYFMSSRDEGVSIKRRYSWNKEPFLDVYVADKNALDSVTINHKNKVKGQVNSVYHDGPVTITADGKTMYFSRTSFIKNSLSRDNSGISNLKIYKAILDGNKWTQVEELPFNDNSYSNGHPALNEDDTQLIFASNMPGGFGGTDLYSVTINSDGSYGKPQNLGSTINTRKNERFPFINNEGTLFFSSDGHHGLGLLDIFVAISNEKKEYINVINLGVPVNSSKDDFSFFMDKNGISGYFASNRNGGIGSDDVYAFSRVARIKLEGTIYDAESNIAIPEAIVTLLNSEGKHIASFKSDENGVYEMNINRNTDYIIAVSKNGFINESSPVSSKEVEPNSQSMTVDFSLHPVSAPKPGPIAKDLGPIYFNFDSASIRSKDTSELDRIVDLMQNKHPEMTIEIKSHSDSRGPSNYNLKLSERRAKSTYDYLVSKGIDAKRIISAEGFGEDKLVNGCDGTVNCTEQQHGLNRRTNFIVMKVE